MCQAIEAAVLGSQQAVTRGTALVAPPAPAATSPAGSTSPSWLGASDSHGGVRARNARYVNPPFCNKLLTTLTLLRTVLDPVPSHSAQIKYLLALQHAGSAGLCKCFLSRCLFWESPTLGLVPCKLTFRTYQAQTWSKHGVGKT